MAFIKTGDPQPIIATHEGSEEATDEQTKEALEAAKQAVKNISEDSNKIELNKKSAG